MGIDLPAYKFFGQAAHFSVVQAIFKSFLAIQLWKVPEFIQS